MKVFTTGQVAKICKVSLKTVSKWFDSGRLKGYRIPGSQDRRIPREFLIQFLKDHGMPLGELDDETMIKVLIVSQDPEMISSLTVAMPIELSFKVSVADASCDLGEEIATFRPDCVIADFPITDTGRVDAKAVLAHKKTNEEVIFIGLLPVSALIFDYFRLGFTEIYQKPVNCASLSGNLRYLISSKKDLL